MSVESPAGRIEFHALEGFGLDEIGVGGLDARWLHGGFPRAQRHPASRPPAGE